MKRRDIVDVAPFCCLVR